MTCSQYGSTPLETLNISEKIGPGLQLGHNDHIHLKGTPSLLHGGPKSDFATLTTHNLLKLDTVRIYSQ